MSRNHSNAEKRAALVERLIIEDPGRGPRWKAFVADHRGLSGAEVERSIAGIMVRALANADPSDTRTMVQGIASVGAALAFAVKIRLPCGHRATSMAAEYDETVSLVDLRLACSAEGCPNHFPDPLFDEE